MRSINHFNDYSKNKINIIWHTNIINLSLST
jgi:hypothetical protein